MLKIQAPKSVFIHSIQAFAADSKNNFSTLSLRPRYLAGRHRTWRIRCPISMKNTLQPSASRNTTQTNWLPLAAALLGLGAGVLGTLTYQHFKPQSTSQTPPNPESSTRFTPSADAPSADVPSAVPEELKHIVPSFGASPATDKPVADGSGSAGKTTTANVPLTNVPLANVATASDQGRVRNLARAQLALSQGNSFYDGRNWSQAALQYEQVIAGGLDNADVRTDLGNCYRFLEQPQKALEQYRRAQKLNPQHEQSLFNQGGLYAFSLKDNARAIAKWREYLQRFPQGATVAEARQLIAQAQSGQLPNQADASAAPKP
jgi:hypothetical protein